ncbi:molybdopterin-synthase adenylyltransferase MoeB [Oceaniserpentilla sp. 4NH20-0058]|uniref:HesA/MoeB/ThiF family protein n=1 Tax=Oceaniserpentilla sp. 4NH20-0058 TaxID=3127660 RepID=UPI00310308B5
MNDEALERYSRHMLLPQLDYDGQQRINNAKVLVLGLGGLGASAAQYLAGAGVGYLTLLDPDRVELSNLHRQVIHNEARLNMNKAQSAKVQLTGLNSSIQIDAIEQLLPEGQLRDLVKQMDVVVDCTDNSASRMLHNRLCVESKTPLVSAAAIRFEGQMMVVDANQAQSPCYECVYSDMSDQQDTCSQSGILGPVVGTMGVLQALETLKIIGKVNLPNVGKLWMFDGLDLSMRCFNVNKNEKCTICSH